MADLPQFNRNYGAMVTAKEFWGGNNGFVTIGVQLPSGYELAAGADFEFNGALAKAIRENTASDAQLVRYSNAQRNLFRVAQALSQRAVLVAISGTELDSTSTDTLDKLASAVGGNTLASGKGGVTAAAATATPIYYVTFMIERADAMNKQENKPGATYALTIDPCAEFVEMLTNSKSGMFENNVFTQDPDGKLTAGARAGAVGVAIKVFDALPVLK